MKIHGYGDLKRAVRCPRVRCKTCLTHPGLIIPESNTAKCTKKALYRFPLSPEQKLWIKSSSGASPDVQQSHSSTPSNKSKDHYAVHQTDIDTSVSQTLETGSENVQFAQVHTKMSKVFPMKRTHEDTIESHKRRKEEQHMHVYVERKKHHQDNYDSLLNLKKPNLDIEGPLQTSSYGQSKPGTSGNVRQSQHDRPLEKTDSISFQDLLDKPPETNDVLGLVKDISALWNELESELHVPLDDRQTLRTDISLSNKDRLESVLTMWIGNETKDVKWRVVLDALKVLQRKDVIKNVIKYLKKPETYTKYISRDDFSPCEY